MAFDTLPDHPALIAPASARKVSTTYTASPSGDAWSVYANTSWKCPRLDGWDGDCARIAHGLTETEARAMAARLMKEQGL